MKSKPRKPIEFDPLIYDDHGIVSGRVLFNIISCVLILIVSMILIIISRSSICNAVDSACIFSTHNHPSSMLSHLESTQSVPRPNSQPQPTLPAIATAPIIAGPVIAAQVIAVPLSVAATRAPVASQITDQQPLPTASEPHHKALKVQVSAPREMQTAMTRHTHAGNEVKTAGSAGRHATLWLSTTVGNKTRLQSSSFDTNEHCLAALHASADLNGKIAHCSLDR